MVWLDPEAVKVSPLSDRAVPWGDTGPRDPGQIQIEPANNTTTSELTDLA
jgi:hypothetical protein